MVAGLLILDGFNLNKTSLPPISEKKAALEGFLKTLPDKGINILVANYIFNVGTYVPCASGIGDISLEVGQVNGNIGIFFLKR